MFGVHMSRWSMSISTFTPSITSTRTARMIRRASGTHTGTSTVSSCIRIRTSRIFTIGMGTKLGVWVAPCGVCVVAQVTTRRPTLE